MRRNSEEENLDLGSRLAKPAENFQVKDESNTKESEDDINEKILKAIDMNRKKIREQRQKERKEKDRRLPQDVDGLENISPQHRALLEKDDACQKEITKREEKLTQLIEKSIQKEKMLTEREKELQKLRERTKKMLEAAKQKELEFNILKEGSSDSTDVKVENKVVKNKSNKDRIIEKANEKAKKLKREMGSKNADSADDDGDLLAFLRKSHKAKRNIYEFIDNPVNENIPVATAVDIPNREIKTDLPKETSRIAPIAINVEPPFECKQSLIQESSYSDESNKPNMKLNEPLRKKSLSENSLIPNKRKLGVVILDQTTTVGSSLEFLNDATKNNSKADKRPKYRFIENPIPKVKHIEDRWEDMKEVEKSKQEIQTANGVNSQINAVLKPNDHDISYNRNHLSVNNGKILVNGHHCATKKEESFQNADLLTPESKSEENIKSNEEEIINNGNQLSVEFEQTLVNGKHWAIQIEESIQNINKLSRSKTPESNSEEDNTKMKHYSLRWSEERSSVSPCKHDSSEKERSSRSHTKSPRPSRVKAPRPKHSRNKTIDSDSSDCENSNKKNSVSSKPPRPGKLLRRKSLSENCLKPRGKSDSESKDVDAFGLPRLTSRNKRSVSLMRDTFLSMKESKPYASCDSKHTQRSISRETRTSNASEFKTRFESGSVSNLPKASQAVSQYKPPQVDKAYSTKVKSKFKDVNTEDVKLPFPNFKNKPPRPKYKPPPPPITNF